MTIDRKNELCPISEDHGCSTTSCGWWDHGVNHCSMRSIAIHLSAISERLEECCAMWLDKD